MPDGRSLSSRVALAAVRALGVLPLLLLTAAALAQTLAAYVPASGQAVRIQGRTPPTAPACGPRRWTRTCPTTSRSATRS